MNCTRWKKLMLRFGMPENLDTHNSLINVYQEKHRFYHITSHIEAVLKHFDKVTLSAIHPEEVELALWFHDAIYAPHSSSNEADSAKWADGFLAENSVSKGVIDRVRHLILATGHAVELVENDEKLIVDIDLAILGCSESNYTIFERNVRKEYKWVPSFIYQKKRKQILQSFLDRERIYSNQYFYNMLESQARSNVTKAILSL